MFAAGTPRSGSIPPVLPATDFERSSDDVETVVSVSQLASVLPWAQLLPVPVTMTTFGRLVVPSGNVDARVTENVRVTEPCDAIDGIDHVSVLPLTEQLLLQSAL